METKEKYFYCSFNDKVIAGVCGGLSYYSGLNTLLIRGLFVIAGFFAFGMLLYLYLATFPPVITKPVKQIRN